MDFGKIGNFLLENGLHLLGGVLGGPAGAGIGTMIAQSIGADSAEPDAIMKTLQVNPDAIMALKQIEETHAHELRILLIQGEFNNLTEVNKTMREEVKSDDWFVRRARPSLIWAVGGSIVLEIFVGALVMLTDPTQMAAYTALCAAIATPQGVAAAMTGVYMKKRSDDKAVAAGQDPKPLFGGVVGKLFDGGGK